MIMASCATNLRVYVNWDSDTTQMTNGKTSQAYKSSLMNKPWRGKKIKTYLIYNLKRNKINVKLNRIKIKIKIKMNIKTLLISIQEVL